MRVYFSGAHSIGKSSLSRVISQKYHLPLLTEVSRIILSQNEQDINVLRANLDETDSYQMQVFNRQLLEEQKYEQFVSDRSLLDTLAYSGQHSRILPELMKSSELSAYLLKLRQADTHIFFIRPSSKTLKIDGVRETPVWDGIVSIDAQIKLLLEMFDIPHIQINTDSMQERMRLITTVLDR